jgi:hypothetical protein
LLTSKGLKMKIDICYTDTANGELSIGSQL